MGEWECKSKLPVSPPLTLKGGSLQASGEKGAWLPSWPFPTPPWGLAPPYSLIRMEVLVPIQPLLVWVGEGLQYFLLCLVPQKSREAWKQRK